MYKVKLDISFIVLSIIISIISLFFLPNNVPVSYDKAANITRYISKYERVFLLPIVMILIYLVISFIEYTLLASHLRFIAEFFKTFEILIFSLENIKKILEVIEVNVPIYISAMLWIGIGLICYEFKINRLRHTHKI